MMIPLCQTLPSFRIKYYLMGMEWEGEGSEFESLSDKLTDKRIVSFFLNRRNWGSSNVLED